MSASPTRARNSALLALFVLAAFAASPRSAEALPIEGKFGLGVDTGDLISSNAEAALIYGRSERMAWLLLVSASGSAGNADLMRDITTPDTLIIGEQNRDGYSFSIGPGIRKFVRSKENFSPYFDVTIRGIRSYSKETSSIYGPYQERRYSEWGAEGGFAIGAEYFFERWPVSLAAHANLLTARYSRRSQTSVGSYGREEIDDDSFALVEGLGPRLQVRVYF